MPRVTQHQRELQVHEGDTLEASPLAGEKSTSPYRRDDHWGSNADSPQLDLAEIEKRGTPKAMWVAKTVLRREATVLCPHCLHHNDVANPISDPEEYVPREVVIERDGGKNIVLELAVLPKAHRYCEECGSVSFGGPLADRDLEEFRAILDELCDSARFVDYPESRLKKERSDALAAKGRESGPHDVRIVTEFVDNLLEA